MSVLKGLSSYCGTLNGLNVISIEYLPVQDVADSYRRLVRQSVYQQLDQIPLASGAWLKAYAVREQQRWDERGQRTAHGVYYRQSVTAILPNLRPAVSAEMNYMASMEFLLRIKDQSGQYWILGTLETPYTFISQGTTGQNGSLKHHRVTFASESRIKSPAILVP